MRELNQDDINDIIGQNIKYFRKLYNLEVEKMTQENLAELADVSTGLIGNLESEKIAQGLSIFTLYKISKALNVPIQKFFDENQGTEDNKEVI